MSTSKKINMMFFSSGAATASSWFRSTTSSVSTSKLTPTSWSPRSTRQPTSWSIPRSRPSPPSNCTPRTTKSRTTMERGHSTDSPSSWRPMEKDQSLCLAWWVILTYLFSLLEHKRLNTARCYHGQSVLYSFLATSGPNMCKTN